MSVVGPNTWDFGDDAANKIQRVRNVSNDLVKFYKGKNGNVSDVIVGESFSADVHFKFPLPRRQSMFTLELLSPPWNW